MGLDDTPRRVHGARMRLMLMAALLLSCGGGDRHEGIDATPRTDSGVAEVDGGESKTDAGTFDSGIEDDCLEPTFTSIYTERLSTTKYCASEGCHDLDTAGGGQNFKLSQALVHDLLLSDTVNAVGSPMWPKRVVPGDPQSSFFWVKVSRDDAPLGRMPLAGVPLQPCDLAAIEQWIENGAMND